MQSRLALQRTRIARWNDFVPRTADDDSLACERHLLGCHIDRRPLAVRDGGPGREPRAGVRRDGRPPDAVTRGTAPLVLSRASVSENVAQVLLGVGEHFVNGDVAPQLLDAETRIALAQAQARAQSRVEIEKRIPKHLLYTKGWPTVMPTQDEAELLCSVRREVADLLGIQIQHADPAALLARYADLMAQKATKEVAAAKSKKKTTVRKKSKTSEPQS